MKLARPFVVAVLALTLLTWASLALADGRVALVVGNSAYAHIGRLPNADNDARDLSAALRRLGFEVTTELDADRGELNEALRAFTRQSLGADVALVFYAGHGMEMDGANYLVPVDARLERDVDVRFETVTLEDMLASTLGASLRLVILDACRNNPLARSMQRTLAGRSVSGGSFGDLNEDLLGDETLVAYAAAAGTTAADGRGRNSPYTSALLAHLDQPLEIGLLFRRVRAQVLASTNGQQRPHEYQSLVREHYLGGRAPVVTVETVEPAAAVDAVVADAVVPPAVLPATVEVALELDREARRLVQRGLAAAGFDPGPPDGVFGPATRAAVRAWQRSRGGVPSGYLDDSSAAALGAPVAPRPVASGGGGASGPPVEASTSAILQQETTFWQSVLQMDTVAAYEEYERQYSNGRFSGLSRVRRAELSAAGDPPTVEAPALGRRYADGEVFRDCDECPEMVVLPEGGLALGRYEVTVGEYRAFAAATGVGAGDCFGTSWRAPGFPQTDRHPVTCVSWDDAQAYVSWLSRRTGAAYRLPTEAESERAASGSQAGCSRARTRNRGTCPVGTYGSNAAGLSDMVGNLWEWTSDCCEGNCGRRVLRGGSWYYNAENLRPGARDWTSAGDRDLSRGFRVSRTLD